MGLIVDQIGGGYFSGGVLIPTSLATGTAFGLGNALGGAALRNLTKYSMLVVGLELVVSMASAQTGLFFYFGEQLGTPSDSASIYTGAVWNMWNEQDYTGYFASVGGGAGNYGGGFFLDPTDGVPWGISFTFLSKSDSSGFGAGGNVTFYYLLTEHNFSHQMMIIPFWVGLVTLVTAAISRNAVAALVGGIMGIGTGALWYRIKELPHKHGSDTPEAAYQLYLNQRQTKSRPDGWNTGDPEPNP